jgi:dienelactone hydrolase
MGLISSLTTRTSSGVGFSWKSAGAHAFKIDVRVRGTRVTSRTFFRSVPGRVVEEPVTTSGLYGRFYTPSIGPGSPTRKRTAILVLGGSEGGLATGPLLTALAAHGYPTLSLAYFRAPGLPQTLENIPLEYFQQALVWLRAQPQVDPDRIVVLGVSFGSQAAQLLGVHYPNLVSAVVASVPSNVATCGIPCSGPAWTFEGRPVPYTREFNDPSPHDNPDAVIPDEQIRGPLFLVCGGLDSAWVSCIYTRAIMSRLAARGHAYRDVSYAYPYAGHYVGGLLPYSPVAPRRLYFNQVDQRARAKVWPHLLSFLARL